MDMMSQEVHQKSNKALYWTRTEDLEVGQHMHSDSVNCLSNCVLCVKIESDYLEDV